jgi:hypothetical protein
MHDAVLTLRDVRTQATAVGKRADDARVKAAAFELGLKLTAVEEELIQVRSDDPRMFPAKLNTRVATMVSLIEYSDAAPTVSWREVFDNLSLRTEMELAKLDRALAEDLPAFNAACRAANVDVIGTRRRSG